MFPLSNEMIENLDHSIMISSLNFFQAREDCDQLGLQMVREFRIANGTSPWLRHHKGHRSNNKDSKSKGR